MQYFGYGFDMKFHISCNVRTLITNQKGISNFGLQQNM